MKRQKESRYWLVSADVACTECEQSHAHGSGKRCVACDKDLCMVCVTVISAEAFCPGCGRRAAWRLARSGKG